MINGSGVYQARALMDWNGECVESGHKSMGSSASDKAQSTAVLIYPNPSNGKFNVIADSEIESISIYELNGSLVSEYKDVLSTELELNVSLKAGIYLVKITLMEGEISDQRLIVE